MGICMRIRPFGMGIRLHCTGIRIRLNGMGIRLAAYLECPSVLTTSGGVHGFYIHVYMTSAVHDFHVKLVKLDVRSLMAFSTCTWCSLSCVCTFSHLRAHFIT